MNYYNYFTEIEETFIRRRGKHLLLSPLDWALIEDWQDRGIPLHVAIRGVETVFDVFDKLSPGTRTIKSLFYCREEVEAQFKEWQAAQVGASAGEAAETAPSEFSPEAVTTHIDTVAASLRDVSAEGDVKDAIDRVLKRLDEMLETREAVERLERSLETLDSVIDDALMNSANADAARKETAKQLAAYKKQMEKDAYVRMLDLMVIKRLRETAGIPRLSLFHL